MFIDLLTNNGKPYLRLVHAVRVENASGKKVSTKKVLLNIGPLDRFDDGEADYLHRLRQSFRAGQPLISSLEPYCSGQETEEKYFFTIKRGSQECIGHPALFSHLLLERILEELGLSALISSRKGLTKMEYDVYGFTKLLVFGRILNPASKAATVRQNGDYYEPILKNFNPDNVYDTLSFIAENKDRIIRRMNTSLVKKAHRDPNVMYYDVTNFYLEEKENILKDEGDGMERVWKKMEGYKEEKRTPLVQMGLFMDNCGIPVAIESFPGDTPDYLTLRPALEKNIDRLDLTRFILIGDRGMCSYPNLLHILDAGNGYIISGSLPKSTKEERQWAYSEEGYKMVSEDFKYKSRVVSKMVYDERGNGRFIQEKEVVYWNRKFKKRCEAENKSSFELLEKLEESTVNFQVSSAQLRGIRKFLGKDCKNKKIGETLGSKELEQLIDYEKVREFKEGIGYCRIVTSELDMEPLDVIDKYHGLTRIEDQFRVMKGVLDTRSLFVRTPEHVDGHLLVCLIALVALRIIQTRIVQCEHSAEAENERRYWSYGLSGERVQRALNKWKVDKLPGDLYRFHDTDDPDLKRILDAFSIEIPAKLFRRAELKRIKTNMKILL
ncbi:MAG: IS1634 family transposase [Lachnospiraceae bacterium]|nr:IS1634 family transposase [Lachnospiraceae bacterium]